MRYLAIMILAGGIGMGAQQRAQKSTPPKSDSEGSPATVEGLIRDIACPIQNKKATSTDFNLDCALECARRGSPLILLADDGTIYVPISQSMPDTSQRERLMPLVGKRARVIGTVYQRTGTRAIRIKEIQEISHKP